MLAGESQGGFEVEEAQVGKGLEKGVLVWFGAMAYGYLATRCSR